MLAQRNLAETVKPWINKNHKVLPHLSLSKALKTRVAGGCKSWVSPDCKGVRIHSQSGTPFLHPLSFLVFLSVLLSSLQTTSSLSLYSSVHLRCIFLSATPCSCPKECWFCQALQHTSFPSRPLLVASWPKAASGQATLSKVYLGDMAGKAEWRNWFTLRFAHAHYDILNMLMLCFSMALWNWRQSVLLAWVCP